MQQVTPAEYINDLKSLLQKECDKITAYKQVYIDKVQYEAACQFRDVEKKLFDFIKTLEIIKNQN